MQTTKKQILSCIKELTESVDFNDVSAFTASSISDLLSISRSLASQYLNELYKEGYLVKVISRPVLFFYKDLVKYKSKTGIEQLEYLSLEALKKDVEDISSRKLFSDIIGSNGSLKSIINNGKASVGYPPYGLPLLLVGDYGVGKTKLAQSLYEYALDSDFISKHKHHSIYEGKEDFLSYVKQAFSDDTIGFIYFSNIETLSSLEQNILTELVNRKPVIVDEKKLEAKKHIVMSTTDVTKLNQSLLSSTSFNLVIPLFQDRPLKEREDLVLHFFQLEQEILDRKFLITQDIMKVLINYNYEDEILGLKRTIRNLVAKSIMDNQEKDIRIVWKDITELLNIESDTLEEDDNYIRVDSYHHKELMNLISIYKNIIKGHSLNLYFNFILSKNDYDKKVLAEIETILRELIEAVNQEVFYKYLKTRKEELVKIIYIMMNQPVELEAYQLRESSSINALISKYQQKDIKTLNTLIQDHFGINLDLITQYILSKDYFDNYNQ